MASRSTSAPREPGALLVARRTTGLLTMLLLLAAMLPAAATAQVVRGRVVDAGARLPVAGAHVLLLDSAGVRQTSVLTNADGAFQLGARTAGRYDVRVEMIGRQTLDRPSIDVQPGQTVDLLIELSLAPIALDALDVRTEQQCRVRPEAGALTQTVWEEARKALSIEAAVRAQGVYRFSIERFTRELDPTRRRVLSQDVRTISRYTGEPFHSRPAEELIEHGFFESRPDGDWLYGPNADVLLSDVFLDTHCFFLRRDGDRPDRIGLAFEPVRGRRIADIEGTLWLDERSAALESIEFAYVNLPGSLPRGNRGGRAIYQRLPDGAFIVSEWVIFSPLVELVVGRFRSQRIGDERIVGVREDGGEILRIEDVRGTTVREATRGVLTGEVWDSSTGGPLVGAHVFLVDTNIGATTGSTGRFRIPNLSAGVYRIAFRHERLEQLGWTPEPVEIDVTPGTPREIRFVVPTTAGLSVTAEDVARLDSIAAAGRALGIDWESRLPRPGDRGLPSERREVGRVFLEVVDHDSGRPIADVEIALTGTPFRGVTSARGRLQFDDVPVGAYELVARHLSYGTQTNPLEVKPGRFLEVSLRLAKSAIALDTLAVVVAERSPWLTLQGFYERRDLGGIGGHFITGEEITRRGTDFLTDVLEDVPGVRVDYDLGPGKRSIRFNRPGFRIGRTEGCEPDLYIDGVLYRNSSAPMTSSGFGANPNKVDDFNVVPPSNIAAVEVYVGAAVPTRFAGSSSSCGVILYWLKR